MKGLVLRLCVLAAPVLTLAGAAQAQQVLFDTGPTRALLFDATNQGNHNLTYLGWSSGNLAAGLEQRWSAQPFTLAAGSWDITQIDANYFNSGGTPAEIGIRIWSRNGQAAPGALDELFVGSVPAPALLPDPRLPGNPAYLGILDVSSLNINLSGGDYYLSIYAIAPQGVNIGWLANPENGINLVDPASGPFMWRSAQYPSPGFATYQLPPTTVAQQPGLDPNDIYNAAFTIHGIPTPGTLGLLVLGGVVAMRRRR